MRAGRTLELTRARPPALGVVVAAAGAAACALLLLATWRWGLGVSYDSVVYLQASDGLSAIPLPQPRDDGGEPLYWWAPLYPLLLAGLGGGATGALVLNAILLVAGTVLVGAILWRVAGPRGALVGAVLYGFSPAVLDAHANLLAEPLFLVLATAALALIASGRGAAAGLATAAAVLTRFAGLPLIVTGGLVLRGRERLRFLVVSVAVTAAWILRNEIAAGQATGRLPRWHPPTWAVLRDGAETIGRLLVTPGRLPSIELPVVDPGRLSQVVAALTLVVLLVRADVRAAPALVRTGLVYAGLYCGFLLVTVWVFDASTPVDARLLVALVPPLVVTVAWLARAQPVAGAILCAVVAVAGLQEARTASLGGIDYSGRIWSAARVDRELLPSGPLYSNWPAAIAYFTGRSPQRLPLPVDPHTLDRNRGYDRDVRRLAAAVRDGRASLVVLRNAFLEIREDVPLVDTAPFRASCRNLTPVVVLCTRRATRGG